MSQNISLWGASYSNVPSVTLPKTGGGTASFTDVTDTTATASDVASGKYFFTASGQLTLGTNAGGSGDGYVWQDGNGYVHLSDEEGTQPIYDTLNVNASGTFTPSQGHAYNSVVVPSGTAGTPSASKGTVTNHAVTVTPSVTNQTGWITGSTKTGTGVSVSASELVSGTYSVTSSGTKDVTNYASASVPSGSVTAPSTISGSSATVSTGTNTLTLSKTVSVTPSVTTAGYVTSGTAGNASVSLTASVNTRSSSDLSASNLTVTAPSGYYASNATKTLSDANLVAGNVKKDVTIFGVTGSYEGSGSSTLITKNITANGTYNASSDNADGYSSVTVNVSGGGISGVATGTLTVASDVSTTTKVTIVSTDEIGFIPTKFLFYKDEDTQTDKCIRMATYAQLGTKYVRTRSIYSTQNTTCTTNANYTDWTTSSSGYLYRSSSDIQISVSSSYILKAGTYTWWAME